jgi:hypothetical protein
MSLLLVAAAMEFHTAANATVRNGIKEPVYTIAHKDCSAALSSGKHVIKLGPMFWGLFPAGVAFETAEDAWEYMIEKEMDNEKWGVYRLSGDYGLDVNHQARVHRINKSLMVIEDVR